MGSLSVKSFQENFCLSGLRVLDTRMNTLQDNITTCTHKKKGTGTSCSETTPEKYHHTRGKLSLHQVSTSFSCVFANGDFVSTTRHGDMFLFMLKPSKQIWAPLNVLSTYGLGSSYSCTYLLKPSGFSEERWTVCFLTRILIDLLLLHIVMKVCVTGISIILL